LILATWDAEITVSGQPRCKADKRPTSSDSWVWWLMPFITPVVGLCNWKDCRTAQVKKSLGDLISILKKKKQKQKKLVMVVCTCPSDGKK
jgi:hypothetical protein